MYLYTLQLSTLVKAVKRSKKKKIRGRSQYWRYQNLPITHYYVKKQFWNHIKYSIAIWVQQKMSLIGMQKMLCGSTPSFLPHPHYWQKHESDRTTNHSKMVLADFGVLAGEIPFQQWLYRAKPLETFTPYRRNWSEGKLCVLFTAY